jgi:hypothetical protein
MSDSKIDYYYKVIDSRNHSIAAVQHLSSDEAKVMYWDKEGLFAYGMVSPETIKTELISSGYQFGPWVEQTLEEWCHRLTPIH